MNKKFFTCIMIFGLFLQGCMVANKKIKTHNKPTIWILEKIENKPLHVKTLHPISLEFDKEENKFFGNDGCNALFGTLQNFDDTKIRFGVLGGTRMACEYMEVSSRYTSLLKKVYFYEIEGLTLVLFDQSKNIILEFSKSQ